MTTDTDTRLVADPLTGEVIPPAAAHAARETWATALASIREAIRDAERELKDLRADEQRLDAALNTDDMMDVDSAISIGHGRFLVREAGGWTQERIDPAVAQTWREQLIGLGLGEDRPVYAPPTAAQVKAARAELIAAGVPVAQLVPPRRPQPSVLRIITRPDAA